MLSTASESTEEPRYNHPAAQDSAQLAAECTLRRTRRSGPGGQHRNKVESAVILTHEPTGLSAEASERRSQHENRQVALFRLRLKLAVEYRPQGSASPTPSPLWRRRCRGGKLAINPQHEDFPALLAEALDHIAAALWDVKAAAAALGCTPSQLVKLLQAEPRSLQLVNGRRRERQLPDLK